MRLVLPATHRLMQEAMITPAHLSDEILLSYPVETQRLDVIRHFMQPVGLKPKQIKMVDNTLMLTQMVAAGWGITVLPDWVCQEFEPQQLMASKSLGKGLWRRLHAAIRVQDRQRPEIQVLLKALQQHPAV
jgi:LysR family transcriptional regulator for metE and metH